VLASLTQEFSLFLEDGTPVRATLRCSFTEYLSEAQTAQSELHSPDVAKTYTVHPGDTLINLAAAFYGDASQWRTIATANRIGNPRLITAGQVLAIPPLRSGAGR
jgi:nucleoid-associated protein YgaU